jgi:hypothetical protein
MQAESMPGGMAAMPVHRNDLISAEAKLSALSAKDASVKATARTQ